MCRTGGVGPRVESTLALPFLMRVIVHEDSSDPLEKSSQKNGDGESVAQNGGPAPASTVASPAASSPPSAGGGALVPNEEHATIAGAQTKVRAASTALIEKHDSRHAGTEDPRPGNRVLAMMAPPILRWLKRAL